jgi:hypothetical protein
MAILKGGCRGDWPGEDCISACTGVLLGGWIGDWPGGDAISACVSVPADEAEELENIPSCKHITMTVISRLIE